MCKLVSSNTNYKQSVSKENGAITKSDSNQTFHHHAAATSSTNVEITSSTYSASISDSACSVTERFRREPPIKLRVPGRVAPPQLLICKGDACDDRGGSFR